MYRPPTHAWPTLACVAHQFVPLVGEHKHIHCFRPGLPTHLPSPPPARVRLSVCARAFMHVQVGGSTGVLVRTRTCAWCREARELTCSSSVAIRAARFLFCPCPPLMSLISSRSAERSAKSCWLRRNCSFFRSSFSLSTALSRSWGRGEARGGGRGEGKGKGVSVRARDWYQPEGA